MLAIVPGHIAAVLVAFAEMGAIRTNSSAGNEMKLPPPATEFSAPATKAARKRNPASPKDTRKNNFSGGWCHLRSARLARRGFLAAAIAGVPHARFASVGLFFWSGADRPALEMSGNFKNAKNWRLET